jgi:hypothetical protein
MMTYVRACECVPRPDPSTHLCSFWTNTTFNSWRAWLNFVGVVYPAYNPYFSACFFSRNSIFLLQQISQQCFSVGLSAQPNGASTLHVLDTNILRLRLVRKRKIFKCHIGYFVGCRKVFSILMKKTNYIARLETAR